MKKPNKKIVLSIIQLSVAVVVFAVAVFGGGGVVFGWFLQNRNVSNDNINAGVMLDTSAYAYDVYMWHVKDESGGKATTYEIIDGAISETKITLDNINLQYYDTVFENRNRYTPVFVRIGISGSTVKREGRLEVVLTKSDAEVGVTAEQTSLSATTSSTIRFLPFLGKEYYDVAAAAAATEDGQYEGDIDSALYEAVSSGLTAGGNSATGVYSGIAAKTDPTGQCFTSLVVTDPGASNGMNDDVFTVTKVKNLTFSLTYVENDWNTVNGTKTLYLYVFMAYDVTYVNYLEGLTGEINGESRETTLTNDLEKITVMQASAN